MTAPITLIDVATSVFFPVGVVLAIAGLFVFSLAWPRGSLAWQRTFGRPGFIALPLCALCTYIVASTFVCLEQRGLITQETLWLMLGVLLVGIYLNVRYSTRRVAVVEPDAVLSEPVAAKPRRRDVDAAAA